MDETDLLEHAPRPGSLFADRYVVERVLGVGGMGFVLAATHLHLRERVAIKMLLPALARSASTVERFLREGRAAVKIRSEHVARVLDVGELPDRTPYLVMEYLDGVDLAQLIESRKKVGYREAVDWILEACEAVAEAHAMRTVHRDLKPANLFLARQPDGRSLIKVLDFGISKMHEVDAGRLAMTKTAAMLGSPLYMSPEQLRSARNVDERADQWSLGVILFELIHGDPPFVAESLAELNVLVLTTEAPRLADVEPVPAELSSIVSTLLQKSPEARFPNLAHLGEALEPFGGPGARDSAVRITAALGMSPSRGGVAVGTARISAPELLAATQPHESVPSLPRDASESLRGHLRETSAGVTAPSASLAESRQKGPRRRVVGIVLACSLALASVGAVLTVASRSGRTSGAAHEPPLVVAPASAPPVSSAVPSAPTTAAEAALPPLPVVVPVTTATQAANLPVAPPASSGKAPARPSRPAPPPPSIAPAPAPSPPPPSPAPAKPPSGIATSSKD